MLYGHLRRPVRARVGLWNVLSSSSKNVFFSLKFDEMLDLERSLFWEMKAHKTSPGKIPRASLATLGIAGAWATFDLAHFLFAMVAAAILILGAEAAMAIANSVVDLILGSSPSVGVLFFGDQRLGLEAVKSAARFARRFSGQNRSGYPSFRPGRVESVATAIRRPSCRRGRSRHSHRARSVRASARDDSGSSSDPEPPPQSSTDIAGAATQEGAALTPRVLR